jgi:uncharacterized delta-60 repeat protein
MRLPPSKSLFLPLLAFVTLVLAGCGPQVPEESAPSPEDTADSLAWSQPPAADSRELSATSLATFSLVLRSSTMTLERGTSGFNTVGLLCENGFTSPVSLSLDAVTGFSATFSPSTVSSTSTSSRMTLSVASNVAPGTYNLTLRGIGGHQVKTTVLQVTVTSPPPTFTLTLKTQLGALTGPLSAPQNRTERLLVQVDSVNGFSAPVNLSLEGLPTGVFSRQENSGSNVTTVHLTVENFSVPGSYSVTVRGEGGGQVKLAPFTLEVTSNPITLDTDSTGADALDVLFGQTLGGIATSQQGSPRTVMALQPADGGIITGAGTRLSRFSAQGVLDRQFERDTFSGVGNNGEPIDDLIVQEDGRIVTVGTLSIFDPFSGTTSNTLTAMRFTPSGAPDTTFGVNGRFTLNSSNSQGLALLPLEWGKTLIGGTEGSKVLVLRLTPGGNADPDFNGDGNIDGKVLVDFDLGSNTFIAHMDMLLDSSGRILVAAIADGQVVLARLHPNGALDTTFGVGGRRVTTLTVHTSARHLRFALDGQGRLLLASTAVAANGFSRDFVVARFLSNGSADPFFGQGGTVTVDFAGFDDTAAALALQPDGKILVAGKTKNSHGNDVDGSDDFALARLGSNGSLDASFGQGGKVIIGLHDTSMPFTGVRAYTESFTDLLVQPDGTILAAGFARVVSDFGFTVLMRFNP